MYVALTVWEDRISPVFDSAHSLLILEIESSGVLSSRNESFNPDRTSHLAEMLISNGVSTLICGAISETPATILSGKGISLIPFIAGKTDDVVNAFISEQELAPLFLMPGCGRRHRQCDRRTGCVRRSGRNKQLKNK